MGNSTSSKSTQPSSFSKSSEDHQDSKYDFKESDEFTDVEKERFAKEMAESLTKQNEKLQVLTKKLENEQKNGQVTPDSWFDAMTTLVKCIQDANTVLLAEMKEPIKQSEAAYTHFRNLVNSPALKKHKDRVNGAMSVYHDYWDLLTKTSKKLTAVMSKVNRVTEAIEDYQSEKKLSEKKLASSDSIAACIKYLNEWLTEAREIETLATGWKDLGDKAEKEEIAWKEIELKSKRKWSRIIKGICVVTGVAAVCGALCFVAGPIGVIAVGAAAMTFLEISTVAAVGVLGFSVFSGGAYGAYKQYKNAKRAREASIEVSKKIGCITSTMSQIASSARAIGDILDQLHNTYIEMKSVTEKIETVNNTLNKTETLSDARKKVLMNRIDTSFETIVNAMIKFNKQCKDCCKTIDESKKAIIAKSKEYNQ